MAMPNKSFDTDTLLQGPASRAGERTSLGALQQRAGQDGQMDLPTANRLRICHVAEHLVTL